MAYFGSRYARKAGGTSHARRDSGRHSTRDNYRHGHRSTYFRDSRERYYPQSSYNRYLIHPRRGYPSRSKYFYKQPSGPVYVEEPETEADDSPESEYDAYAQSDEEEVIGDYNRYYRRRPRQYSREFPQYEFAEAYPQYISESEESESSANFEIVSERDLLDESELDTDDEVYNFTFHNAARNSVLDAELDDSESDFHKEYEEIFIVPNDEDGIHNGDDIIDINDLLEHQFYDDLEAEGQIHDVNDDLVRFYDSKTDTESESESSDSEVELEVDSDLELITGIEPDSSSESNSCDDCNCSDSSLSSQEEEEALFLKAATSDSDSDSIADSYTDLELDTEEEAEFLRQALADKFESSDEISTAEEEDHDLFFEVNSNFYNSDDEFIVDCNISEYESDSDSDGEGITIYKHQLDLPGCNDSEKDFPDPELKLSSYDRLLAHDSDNEEFKIIDLSKDLKNSRDCDVEELDEKTYKMTLRLPSLVKEDLDIKFLKNENELVISGKFNFTGEESDNEDGQDDETADSCDNEEGISIPKVQVVETPSSCSNSSDSSDEGSNSETSSSSSSLLSSSESGDFQSEISGSEDSDNEEEVVEDAESLIKEFKSRQIYFEKRYQFDKLIKFEEVKAFFTDSGELELIIPNEGETSSRDKNTVSITIDGLDTHGIAAAKEVVEEAAAVVTKDVEMLT